MEKTGLKYTDEDITLEVEMAALMGAEELFQKRYEEWADGVITAAKRLVKCKGRYHAELNYKALEEALTNEPKRSD